MSCWTEGTCGGIWGDAFDCSNAFKGAKIGNQHYQFNAPLGNYSAGTKVRMRRRSRCNHSGELWLGRNNNKLPKKTPLLQSSFFFNDHINIIASHARVCFAIIALGVHQISGDGGYVANGWRQTRLCTSTKGKSITWPTLRPGSFCPLPMPTRNSVELLMRRRKLGTELLCQCMCAGWLADWWKIENNSRCCSGNLSRPTPPEISLLRTGITSEQGWMC